MALIFKFPEGRAARRTEGRPEPTAVRSVRPLGGADAEGAASACENVLETLDRLDSLLAKVAPFADRLGEAEAGALLRSEIADARSGLHAARRNAMLLEGILPV